ncbi:MAG: M2 family metallopeptidase, partial [Acetobacteraceae bacterium]|nr:M2 family metallopeptidase [Acetobacteraceae bacterium]
MEAADRAVNRHYARPAVYGRIQRLLQNQDDLDALTRRRLQRLARAYRAKQAPLEILDRITSAEAAVQETYSTFRARFEGRAVQDNELEDILRVSTDSARAHAAWEARKQIGPVVSDELRRLAHLRNDAGRAIGFADYWHAQLLLDELDPERLVGTLDQVEAATRAPFMAMKADLDGHLARRFNVSVAELRPWHYADP